MHRCPSRARDKSRSHARGGLESGELIVGHSVKAGGAAKAAGNEGAAKWPSWVPASPDSGSASA